MTIHLGSIYYHYKNPQKFYRIVCLGRHVKTKEEFVVYESLYDDAEFPKGSIWIRPKDMFLEQVAVDGQQVPRFTLVSEKTSLE